MTDNFYPLTCDDDLLLIDKDTFTVARFKEFAMELKFCPDEPEPLETSDSALDELRQQLQIYQ